MGAKPFLALVFSAAAVLAVPAAFADPVEIPEPSTSDRDGGEVHTGIGRRGGEHGVGGVGSHAAPPQTANRPAPRQTPRGQTPPSQTPAPESQEQTPDAAPFSPQASAGTPGGTGPGPSPAASSGLKSSNKKAQSTAAAMANVLKQTFGADTTAGPLAGKTPPPAGPSPEPRAQTTDAPRAGGNQDLVAAASTGFSHAFRAEGLRAAPGRDGLMQIVDAAGRPADGRALDALRKRIEEQPRMLIRRPDLYQVIDPVSYAGLQARLTVPGASSTPEFKHMARPARDYVWTKSCEKVSGDCNPNAEEGSYKKDEEVSPETLANINKRLKEIGEGGDKDWEAYVAQQNEAYEKATAARARGGFMKLSGLDRLLSRLSGMGGGRSAEGVPSGAAGALYSEAGVISMGGAQAAASAAGARARGSDGRGHGGEYYDGRKPKSWPWMRLLFAALGLGIFFYARHLKRREEQKDPRIKLTALALLVLLSARPSHAQTTSACASMPPHEAGASVVAALSRATAGSIRALAEPLAQWFLDPERMQGPDLDALVREADAAAEKLVPGASPQVKACLKERRDLYLATATSLWRQINVLHLGHDGTQQKRELVGRGVDEVASKLRGLSAALPADAVARAREAYIGRSKVDLAKTPAGKVSAALERFEPKIKDPKLKTLSSFLLSGGFDADERRHWAQISAALPAMLQSAAFSADERAALEARMKEIERRMEAQASWEVLSAKLPPEQKAARAQDFDVPDLRDRLVQQTMKTAIAPEVIEASILAIKAAPIKYNVFDPPPPEKGPALTAYDPQNTAPVWRKDLPLGQAVQLHSHNWLNLWRERNEQKLENVAWQRDVACERSQRLECATLWGYTLSGHVVNSVVGIGAAVTEPDEKKRRHAFLTTFTPLGLTESVPLAKEAYAGLWRDGFSWKGAGIALLATTSVALDAVPFNPGKGTLNAPIKSEVRLLVKAEANAGERALRAATVAEKDKPQVIRNAGILEPQDRIKAAQTQLGLDERQANAVLQAHERVPCVVYLCTQEQLKSKLALLTEGGLSPQQAKDAIRLGLAGMPVKEGLAVSVPRTHGGLTNGVVEAVLNDGRVLVRFEDPLTGPYTKKLFPDQLQNPLSTHLGDIRTGTPVSILRSDGRLTDAVVDTVDGKAVRVVWNENGVPLEKTLKDITELRPRQTAVLQALEQQGVRFENTVRVGGDTFSFSGFFKDEGGRLFSVLRKETADGPVYSVVYRSNSSSVFRNLPAYHQERGWYDKGAGLSEEALALSPRLQEFLSGLKTNSPPTIRPGDLDGLLPVLRTEKEYERLIGSPDYIRRFVRGSTEILPEDIPRTLKTARAGHKAEPQNLVIRTAGAAPDYSKPVQQYSFQSPVYGNVRAEVYASADGKLRYTLLRDDAGRAWFGDISDGTARLTHHGVGQSYVKSHELLTPLWEYPQQLPFGYTGTAHPTNRSYALAWDYIREIPDIQRYYRERNLPIPAASR